MDPKRSDFGAVRSEFEAFKEKWSEATRRFDAGSRAEALALFMEIAQEGFVEAFAEIGNIHEIGGGGVEKDTKQAIEWYQRAIEAMDDADAHLGLGRIYLAGDLETLNVEAGIVHLQHAASMNSAMAQSILGCFYILGKYVQQDFAQAESILRKAIQAGYVWPILLMSGLEKERGNWVRSYLYRVRAACRVVTLRSDDKRMWNVANS